MLAKHSARSTNTSDLPTTEMLLMWAISPSVILLGVFGNVLAIMVVYRLNRRFAAFTFYIAALAVSDTTLLLFSLFPRWVASLVMLELEDSKAGHWLCVIDGCLYNTAFTASSWFLAAMVTQRAVASVWPQTAKRFFAIKLAMLAVCIITFVSAFLSWHLLFSSDLDYRKCYLGGRLKLRHSTPKEEFWTWFIFASSFLCPLVVITVGNVLIIARLGTYVGAPPSSTAIVLGNSSAHDTDRPHVKDSCWHKMIMILKTRSISSSIIMISLAFFIFLTPGCVAGLLVASGCVPETNISPSGFVIFEEMQYVNSAVNFYLYYLSGSYFRKEAKRIMNRCLCQSQRNGAPPSLPVTPSSVIPGKANSAARREILVRWHRAARAPSSARSSDRGMNRPKRKSHLWTIPEEPTPSGRNSPGFGSSGGFLSALFRDSAAPSCLASPTAILTPVRRVSLVREVGSAMISSLDSLMHLTEGTELKEMKGEEEDEEGRSSVTSPVMDSQKTGERSWTRDEQKWKEIEETLKCVSEALGQSSLTATTAEPT